MTNKAEAASSGALALWYGIITQIWQLAAEATLVVPLRISRIAEGGAEGRDEAERMVTEKVSACRTLCCAIASGKYGARPDRIAGGTLEFYLKRVRANRQRLAKSMLKAQ